MIHVSYASNACLSIDRAEKKRVESYNGLPYYMSGAFGVSVVELIIGPQNECAFRCF